jgi:hypothetical protein
MMDIEVPLFRIRNGGSVAFRARSEPKLILPPGPASPGATSLALGHRLAKAVDQGEATDFTELATLLGVTQARVSQLVALTFLAPDIQEEILEGTPAVAHLTIHHLLLVARLPAWSEQRAFWIGFRGSGERVSGREGLPLNSEGGFPAPQSARTAEKGVAAADSIAEPALAPSAEYGAGDL